MISYSKEAKKYLQIHKKQQKEVILIINKLKEYFVGKSFFVELIENEILINIIVTSLLDSINILKRFDEEWWAKRFASNKNFINIDILVK